jgi:NADP-dependent 3-hydroxy acid dehydrogenase YdfG
MDAPAWRRTADRIIGVALDRFGRIDTLVNNAGVVVSKPFTDYTAADYTTVTGVNLTGYGGRVVNISAPWPRSRTAAHPRCWPR